MADPGTGPGAYLLYKKKDELVHYVCRSDTNLKERLDSEDWECPNCGVDIEHIKFWDLKTQKQAYDKECKNFHKYKNL